MNITRHQQRILDAMPDNLWTSCRYLAMLTQSRRGIQERTMHDLKDKGYVESGWMPCNGYTDEEARKTGRWFWMFRKVKHYAEADWEI